MKFEIPQGTKALKITQVSDPFNQNDLTVELYLYKDNSNTAEPEIAKLKNINKNNSNGIIMKSLNTDFKNYPFAAYVVSNYSDTKIYAVVIELIFTTDIPGK